MKIKSGTVSEEVAEGVGVSRRTCFLRKSLTGFVDKVRVWMSIL